MRAWSGDEVEQGHKDIPRLYKQLQLPLVMMGNSRHDMCVRYRPRASREQNENKYRRGSYHQYFRKDTTADRHQIKKTGNHSDARL